jgi:DNA-binding NtrC family response regulator
MPDGGQRCDLRALLRGPTSRLFCCAMQKVLVVDDEPELVRLLGQTLGAAGFAAVGARSGERALELLSEQEFDAALVDKNLGRGIDGVELLRHLRKRQPRCACIMMTAYPSMGSAVEALRIGAQDYVEKPSPELDTIGDRVQSAIRAVKLRDERDGLLVKLTALQQELKDKDSRVRDLEIQLAVAEQVGTGRADESMESLVRASRDRDARLIQAAEKLVQMARLLRANEKLVRAIEAHVAALRRG